ncbi:MAG: hypothetical protein RR828_08280, partial [Oscillospiraceae bacterium]
LHIPFYPAKHHPRGLTEGCMCAQMEDYAETVSAPSTNTPKPNRQPGVKSKLPVLYAKYYGVRQKSA